MLEEPNLDHINIWQQNTRKSLTVQLATLHSVEDKYDVICIQEPYFDFQSLSRATGVWTSVYPSGFSRATDGPHPRALTLIHTRISTNSWVQVPVNSLDIVAVQFTSDKGVLNVYNIYNDCSHSDTIRKLDVHMASRVVARSGPSDVNIDTGDIWLGDFNRHNPWWEDPSNSRLFTNRNLNEAQILIDLLSDYDMDLALPQYIPTIVNSRGGNTRPDNVFISQDISNWIVKCNVLADRPPKADHFPIITHIDFLLSKPAKTQPWNFRATDWDQFRRELDIALRDIPISEQLHDAVQIDAAVLQLETAVLETMEKVVPKSNPTPHSKRWWTKDLDAARRKSRRAASLAKQFSQFPRHSSHELARRLRNDYNILIDKTKQQHWNNWLDSVSSKTIWDAHKFTAAPASDGSKARIPTLRVKNDDGTVTDILGNQGKSEALHKVFFYQPPADFGVDPDFHYDEPTIGFEEVANEQITRVARSLNPYKAPGLNGISNSILTHCADLLSPHLGPIFRSTFRAGYYPHKWKRYKTIVLRKPGKPDYNIPNAYRPIALLDVFAKLLSSCVKELWEYHVERLNLLPKSQYGGRKGRTATDAVHSLVDFTKRAWRRRREVIILFLDIKGAFPNVAVPVLVHDMRRMGFHPKYTDWITNKTTDRETVLAFDDYVSQPFGVKHGLDQGCNLSPFLYNCYSADQMKAFVGKTDELGNTFADDGVCAVSAESLELAGAAIGEMFRRPEGPQAWGASHHSLYDLVKSGALAATRKKIVDPNNPRKRIKQLPVVIQLDDQHQVTTASTQKYLGIIIDSEFRFKEQAAFAIGKGTKWTNQVRRVTRTVKGIRGGLARRLYYSVAVASTLYAVDVWCAPSFRKVGSIRAGSGVVAKLDSVQRKAAIQVTGALRTTPSDLLFAHADMAPMRWLINSLCYRAAVRLATLDECHPLHRAIHKAASKYPRRHASPLHDILHISKVAPFSIETIDSRPRHPGWAPPFSTSIAHSKEEACAEDRECEADIKIYSDGSGKEEGVGAAAILYFGFRVPRTARYHLGSSSQHTVYEGECVGQLLGLRLLLDSGINLNRCEISIGVDNQAAIKRHNNRMRSSGSYIMDEIYKSVGSLLVSYPRARFTVRWTPGHAGLAGNEAVDVEAKKAAGSSTHNVRSRFGILTKALPISRAAHKLKLTVSAARAQFQAFQTSPRLHRTRRFDTSMPSSRFRKSTATMPKRSVSILTQLRTNHAPLQAYLHRFKLVDSPTCPHCNEHPETVTHYLMHCNSYAVQRNQLRRDLKSGRRLDLSVLGDKLNFPALFKFINATKRFEDTYGDLSPAIPGRQSQ